MRILIISGTGYALGFVPHLEKEGHSVHVLKNGVEGLSGIDLALVDTHIPSETVEQLHSLGSRVFGSNNWTTLIETDSSYKNNLIKAIGYNLADKDTKGIKATVSCWFNSNDFISRILVFNYDRLMAGDVGVKIDCAGYIACFGLKNSKLVSSIMEPLRRFLRKAGHKGCFSVDLVINDGGVYVSDISASITKPYTQAVFENTHMSKSEVLLAIMNEASKEIPHIDPYVCGVLLSVYPYPSMKTTNTLIEGINPSNIKHTWLMTNKDGDVWKCNSCIGYVMARGVSPEEVKRRAYRTASLLQADDIQYRNDIGKSINNEQLFKLRQLKLI